MFDAFPALLHTKEETRFSKAPQRIVALPHPSAPARPDGETVLSALCSGAIPSLGEIRNCHINVGTGKELTIREFSELMVKAVGFDGEVAFYATNPTGPPQAD